MKFSRETGIATSVRQLAADGIRIGNAVYDSTLLVTADAVVPRWTDKPVAELTAADFEELVTSAPELVLLGTGAHGRFAPRELVFAFARQGIGFEVMDTAAAARTYNVLAGEGRRVVAVLYPHIPS